MAEHDMQRRRESLKRYIPFLQEVIEELRIKGDRPSQLHKMRMLYDMVVDPNKLKSETVHKAECALSSIYSKLKHQLKFTKNLGLENLSPSITSPEIREQLSRITSSPRSTPQSPSPSREIIQSKPVTIPTEKIAAPVSQYIPTHPSANVERQRIEVYSKAVIETTMKKEAVLIKPDMSRPPISIEDLKTLEEDVQQKIVYSSFSNKSVHQLEEELKQIKLELSLDQMSTDNANIKAASQKDSLLSIENTNTCNSTDGLNVTQNLSCPIKEIKSPTKTKSNEDKAKNPSKDTVDMFGSLLSSIDHKILGGHKKHKSDKKSSSKQNRYRSVQNDVTIKSDDKRKSSKCSKSNRTDVNGDRNKTEIKDKDKVLKSENVSVDMDNIDSKSSSKVKTAEQSRDMTEELYKKNDSCTSGSSTPKGPDHSQSSITTSLKRLADKYNPKPRSKNDIGQPDDKHLSRTVQQESKPKPISMNIKDEKNVSLPEILQTMINKSTSNNMTYTALKSPSHIENRFSAAMIKPGALNPPEAPILSPPRKLNFQPPRFISPPQGSDALFPETVVRQPKRLDLGPTHLLNSGFMNADFDASASAGTSRSSNSFDGSCKRLDPRLQHSYVSHAQEHPVNRFNRNFAPHSILQPNNQFDTQAGMGAFLPSRFSHIVPDVTKYVSEQQFYHDRSRWNQNRQNMTSPRSYGEYREMRERQKREAHVRSQERQKDTRDPRLAARNTRDGTSWDEKNESQTDSKNELASMTDCVDEPKDIPPKLDVQDRDRLPTCYPRERSRPLLRGHDSIKDHEKQSKERQETSKFDKIYSRTRANRSMSPSRCDEKDAFASPLNSLYNAGEKGKTGRGYGLQSFKIPKKNHGEKEQKSEKDIEKHLSRKKHPPKILSSSDESDTHDEKIDCQTTETVSKEIVAPIANSKVIITIKDVWDTEAHCEDEFVSAYYSECADENGLVADCDNEISEISKLEQIDTLVSSEGASDNHVNFSTENDPAGNPPSNNNRPEIPQSGQCPLIEAPDNVLKSPIKPESSDQSVLVQFFGNLLKSNNKQEKKSALFSLIETFSDSFDDREIQRIRDIINIHEEKEEEVQVTEPKEDVKSSNASTNEKDLATEVQSNELTESENVAGQSVVHEQIETSTSEISLSSDNNKSNDAVPQMSNALCLEPVLVSVGERIKNRKRTPVHKPRKKLKTELDKLHTDIQDMFIRDGILTATGKRMCRILKDDPNGIVQNNQSPHSPISPQIDKTRKIRKKPGPKPKSKSDINLKKELRVVINRIPLDDSSTHVTGHKRSRSRTSNFTETDEDEGELNRDSLSRKSESDTDPETSENLSVSTTSDDAVKPRIKRRKVPKWASGIITKVKKKKPQQFTKSDDNSPDRINNTLNTGTDSCTDIPEFIQPDKNYYYDYSTKEKIKCKLCDFKGHLMPGHYLREHPQSEVLCSRFPSKEAEAAIKDSISNAVTLTEKKVSNPTSKYNYICRMCRYECNIQAQYFYEHVTTHTGEYRHQCGVCEFVSATSKSMSSHFITAHPDQEKKTFATVYTAPIVYAYICGDCYFVQLKENSVQDHVNIFHTSDTTIYKVNMSSIVDPLIICEPSKDKHAQKSLVEEKTDKCKRRMKPCPKSKKRRYVDDAQEAEYDDQPDTLLNDNGPSAKSVKPKSPGYKSDNFEPTSSPRVPIRKKPGPKSRRVKRHTERMGSDEKGTDIAVNVTTKPGNSKEKLTNTNVMSRRRRRSPDNLVPNDSTDDLDSIITLSVRSSRAAKAKATAKLKTLMENNEGSVIRRKTGADSSDSDSGEEMTQVSEEPSVTVTVAETRAMETNVFTCKADVIQDDARKIEEDRLKQMEELKTIICAPRKLDFVDKLSTRLSNQLTEVKEEPISSSSVEKNDYSAQDPDEYSDLPPLIKLSKPAIAKKPVFEEAQVSQNCIKFDQNKSNSLFSNTIEKLQGKVTAESTRGHNVNTVELGLSATNNNRDVIPVISIGNLITVTKVDGEFIFSCRANNCYVSTKDKIVFQIHCKFGHNDLDIQSSLCEKCGVVIDVTKDTTLLENLYDHLVYAHSDFQALLENPHSTHHEIGTHHDIKIETINDQSTSNNSSSPVKSKEPDCRVDIEKRIHQYHISTKPKENEEYAETLQSSDPLPDVDRFVHTNNDALEPSEIEEDNAFPFRIASVVSLAETNDSVDPSDTSSKPVEKANFPVPSPPLQPLRRMNPSFNIIESTSSNKSYMSGPSSARIEMPKKTAKALQKFLQTPGDLYKCPHYYCMFSTNVRVYLTYHLKAHNYDKEAMIPCVYCDVKTRWYELAVHIQIRHSACLYACSYCLYRATILEYVALHLQQSHPDLIFDITVLASNKETERMTLTFTVDPKKVCKPFKCKCWDENNIQAITHEFLFEADFVKHLSCKHLQQSVTCSHENCSAVVYYNQLVTHWATQHGVHIYQCAYCREGSVQKRILIRHQAQSHSGLIPDIICRDASNNPLICSSFGYTDHAFKYLTHIRTLPASIMKTIYQSTNKQFIFTLSQSKLQEEVSTNRSSSNGADSGLSVGEIQSTISKIMKGVPFRLRTSTIVTNESPSVSTTNADDKVEEENRRSSQANTSETLDILQTAIQSILDPLDGDLENVLNPLEENIREDPGPPPLLYLPKTTSLLKTAQSQPEMVFLNSPDLENLPVDHIELSGLVIDTLPASVEEDPLGIDKDSESTTSIEIETSKESSAGNFEPHEPEARSETLHVSNPAVVSDDDLDNITVSKKKHGLMCYQLFRCAMCSASFPNIAQFKAHVISSVNCRSNLTYICVHCDKRLKTPHNLVEHIMMHGVLRFSCSLCTLKFTTAKNAKLHMVKKHSIQNGMLVPVKADRSNMEADHFIIKPSNALQTPQNKEGATDVPKTLTEKEVYQPEEMNIIPSRQIFSSNVRCARCSYQTKVRVNIIRHLQMHLQEQPVSETAPVNPVPCLEKNEKMFDKMINLAASSITTNSCRMGGQSKDKEQYEKIPEFIPAHRRYVCCAEGCSYLCPEEGNLKHHLMALHNDDSSFKCAHCQSLIKPADIENVIRHVKLHGLHLYKCHYCPFLHHLRHKLEKHLSDLHPDVSVRVVTIRSMEAEPPETSLVEENSNSATMTKTKSWSCCMCKSKNFTIDEIRIHIMRKHNLDTQYKCMMCAFKDDEKKRCEDHFRTAHPGFEYDILTIFQEIGEETVKDYPISFDTTPLWQRDKPRVRHIRGILFDDNSPQPSKVARKSKSATSVKGIASVQPQQVPAKPVEHVKVVSTKNASATTKVFQSKTILKHVDDCIDAVVKGTATTLEKLTTECTVNMKDPPISAVSPPISKISEVIKRDESTDKLLDDDVILVPHMADVIVINSDESDTESSKEVSTRNPLKYDVHSSKSNLTRTFLEDAETALMKTLTKTNLMKTFGESGKPCNRQWLCPKCENFKSKKAETIIYHLFTEFGQQRYNCTLCKTKSVSYQWQLEHMSKHPDATPSGIEQIKKNIQLETWIHMVLREQALKILQGCELFKKQPLTAPTNISCYFCKEKFMTVPDCCEHMFYHWAMMPFPCGHCQFEFYTKYDLRHHYKIEHPDEKIPLDPKGATIDRAMQCFEVNKTKKKAGLSCTNPKKVKVSDTPVIHLDDDSATDNMVYACNLCHQFFSSRRAIVHHLGIRHKTSSKQYHLLIESVESQKQSGLGCNVCNREFDNELTLRYHFNKTHPGEQYTPIRFRCAICQKKFSTLEELEKHSKINHPNKPIIYIDDIQAVYDVRYYECPQCTYCIESSDADSLKRHMRDHFKHIQCKHCDMRFATQDCYEEHHQRNHKDLELLFFEDSKMLRNLLEALSEAAKNAPGVFAPFSRHNSSDSETLTVSNSECSPEDVLFE